MFDRQSRSTRYCFILPTRVKSAGHRTPTVFRSSIATASRSNGDGTDGGGGGIQPGDGDGKNGGGGIRPRLRAAKLAAQYDALAADPVIETGGVGIP